MSELRLRADAGLRRWGRTLVGGSPLRLLRLSPAGARLAEGWFLGEPVADSPAQRTLASRLVRAGIAHPHYQRAELAPHNVTVVIPVRDHGSRLPQLRAALGEVARVVVVDDGSAEPVPDADIRHATARGPAAARNAGWRIAATELVAFVDADAAPEPGWLAPLLRQLADPELAMVAPRIRSVPGRGVLARYELLRSSLDLGDAPAEVRPGSVVSYLPSAALLVRTEVLRRLGGFDEELRFGEDVDLVWRAVAAELRVRYEPSSIVGHQPRERWSGWLRQRFDYGTSAAALAKRHGKAVAPVRVSRWSVLSWLAVLAGRPLLGLGVAAGSAALLPRKLTPLGLPATASLRLALSGHVGAGRMMAGGVAREWWPVAVPLLLCGRWGRAALALTAVRHLARWRRARPDLDITRWLAASVADDLAYGAGVWWGCWRLRTVTPLLPDMSDWPGRR
ncbi:MAG: mycofactocin biosynthesis glycosyltransferase MftF [Sciscionella sp.]